MIAQLSQWILEAIRIHGAWSVFLGVLIEQIIIPIPSPVIIMGAGAIMVPLQASWLEALRVITLEIVFPGCVASILGALLCYFLGQWGGKLFVDRFSGYLGFSWKDVEWMGSHFTQRGEAVTLFFSRAIPIVPLSLVSLVGGVFKVPLNTFLLWSFLGSIPRCFLLGFLGWRLGAGALNWAKGVNRYESLVSLLFVFAVAWGVVYLRRRVQEKMSD